MNDPIATRRFAVFGSRTKSVTCRFARPYRVGRDWACSYEVKGLSRGLQGQAFGVDSVQALLMAVEAARTHVAESRIILTGVWSDVPGGFPRLVPAAFGLEFATRVGALIDREVASFARKAKRDSKHREAGVK